MIRLSRNAKYRINNLEFVYIGFVEGDYNCDKCGQRRQKTHWFIQGLEDNPTQVAKYGSECIKHVDIKEVK